MRKLRVASVVLVGIPLGLTGCFRTTYIVPMTQAPGVYKTASVDQLKQELTTRDQTIRTLNASVLITATTGGGRTGKVTEYTSFRGYIFVRQPESLRVILQLPVIGSRAMDMVSDGKTFTLIIPPRNKAIVGTNAVTKPSANGLENLRPAVFLDSLLVPGVEADEFVALTESERVVQPQQGKHPAIEEPDYDLAVMKVKTDKVLQRLRTVHFNRVTMLPFEQDIYNEDGQIVTRATYENYQTYGDQQFPSLITIRRPQDQYSLKIQITKLTLNDKLEDDQFQLTVPPTYTVQKME